MGDGGSGLVRNLFVFSLHVETTSLLHIMDTFRYQLLSDSPTPLFHPGPHIPIAWEQLLSSHRDKIYAYTIGQIIRHGAQIGYMGPNQLILSTNLPSVNDSIETLKKDL